MSAKTGPRDVSVINLIQIIDLAGGFLVVSVSALNLIEIIEWIRNRSR
jgi:hypothetical protein